MLKCIDLSNLLSSKNSVPGRYCISNLGYYYGLENSIEAELWHTLITKKLKKIGSLATYFKRI